MRLSPTQIRALHQLLAEGPAGIHANTLQALRHRGLADNDGNPTQLAREAAAELRPHQEEAGRPEIRIHLDTEPATQAQLRLLSKILAYMPDGLPKNGASQLISFLKDQQRTSPATLAQRGTAIVDLLKLGAQPIDAIGYSDPGPYQTASGGSAHGFIARSRIVKGGGRIVPAVRQDDLVIEGKEVHLRNLMDVPVSVSRAREIFENLAKTIP